MVFFVRFHLSVFIVGHECLLHIIMYCGCGGVGQGAGRIILLYTVCLFLE
jgi:hypothetical protein